MSSASLADTAAVRCRADNELDLSIPHGSAAGAQRNERHRKREKAAIRRLEAEAENPGAKQCAEQSEEAADPRAWFQIAAAAAQVEEYAEARVILEAGIRHCREGRQCVL